MSSSSSSSALPLYPKSSINIQLFPHQITSVNDMEKLELDKRRDLGNKYIEMTMGILGDLPGGGKTLSMICVIDRDKMKWDMDTQFEYEEVEAIGPASTYITRRKIKKERLDCTLIIASTSLIWQWEREMNRAKKLSYHTITKKTHFDVDPDDYHVILCSDTMYNKFVENFESFAWKRFVFDEAASTHIPSMNTIYAGFYWFITATFPNLSNIRGTKKHFLKTIFSTISQLTFEYMLVKNHDEYVKSSYNILDPNKIIHKCINPGVLKVVGDIVSSDISIMISAGNIDGALKLLGGEDGPKNIIEVVTHNTIDELDYSKKKVEEHYESRNKDSVHTERYKMWTDRVVTLEKKLNTINDRFSKVLDDDCSICSETLKNPVLLPCCQNIVCLDCIHKWISSNPSCHMCRSTVKIKELIPIDVNYKKEGSENKLNVKSKSKKILNKQDTIINIINENPDGKFIVFSAYEESFKIIKKTFSENDISFVEIKGTRESRDKKLKQYREGDINVIFLNSKYNGAGIELQITSDIIIYHEMDDQTEIQLIGRANRIGRNGRLNVHYLEA